MPDKPTDAVLETNTLERVLVRNTHFPRHDADTHRLTQACQSGQKIEGFVYTQSHTVTELIELLNKAKVRSLRLHTERLKQRPKEWLERGSLPASRIKFLLQQLMSTDETYPSVAKWTGFRVTRTHNQDGAVVAFTFMLYKAANKVPIELISDTTEETRRRKAAA